MASLLRAPSILCTTRTLPFLTNPHPIPSLKRFSISTNKTLLTFKSLRALTESDSPKSLNPDPQPLLQQLADSFVLPADYFSQLPRDLRLDLNDAAFDLSNGTVIDEVLWVENMEVPECQTQDSIYTAIINTNKAFCAKVWVSTLIWGLKRNYRRRLVNTKIPMTNEVHTRMRKLSESMKMVYLDIVRGIPDVTKWIRISNGDERLMMYALENPDHKLGLINYVAVTSFRVQAEPLSMFNFLVKSRGLQEHASPNSREPEEVIKAVSGIDDSYCISLYDKGNGFMLQEASRNGFCSFIISTPLNLPDINSSVYDGQVLLLPSGFAIMADGSDASLVTIAVQQKIDVDESAQVIESMKNLITSTIIEICEESKFSTLQCIITSIFR